MTKRKFKFNVLDLLILLLIVCMVAVMVFRDTITEFFGEPEIIPVRYSVIIKEVTREDAALFSEGVRIGIASGRSISETVLETKTATLSQKDGCFDITVCVSGYGYKKFGKYYIGEGIRLSHENTYTVKLGEKEFFGRFGEVISD